MEILTDHVVYMTTEGKAKEVKEYLQARFYKLLLLFKFELDYIITALKYITIYGNNLQRYYKHSEKTGQFNLKANKPIEPQF